MPIRFVCPLGHSLVVPDDRAGKRGRCPVCNQRVSIPRPDTSRAGDEPESAAEVTIEIDRDRRSASATHSAASAPAPAESLPDPMSPAAFARRSAEPAATLELDGPRESFRDTRSASRKPKYEAPPQFRRRGYVALALASLATAMMAAPAFKQFDGGAPWVWIDVALGAVSAIYILWAVRLLDWSTVWIGTWLFFAAAAIHAALFGMCLAVDRASWPLGLSSAEGNVAGWGAVLALMLGSVALVCRIVARPWRDDYEAFRAGPEAVQGAPSE